jgi:hypothetical protein
MLPSEQPFVRMDDNLRVRSEPLDLIRDGKGAQKLSGSVNTS